jgi:CBS domain-containing protein
VKLFGELLATATIEPRPGLRDLVTAARREGLRLAATTMLKRGDAETLLVKTLGAWAPDAFIVVAAGEESEGEADEANALLYRAATEQIGVGPDACLALEATAAGARGAERAGMRVILTPSAYCSERGLAVSTAVFEDLPTVLSSKSDQRREKTLNSDRHSDLIASLHRYHAGLFEASSEADRSDAMRVSDVLKVKGSAVKTIEPNATLKVFAQGLNAERVGAMVVRDAAGALKGIISERDLVRGFAEYGAELQGMKVADLMTRQVVTCSPDDGVAAVANVMTQRRIRHLPVVVNGEIAGLISIGDVLKHRLDEVQLEANVLRDFAIARR